MSHGLVGQRPLDHGRLCPLPKALQIVSGGSRETVVMPDSNLQKRLAQAIDLLLSANIWIFKPICWKRAAILHRYLSLNGMRTRIIFGIRNDQTGKVSGHAWVELLNQSQRLHQIMVTTASRRNNDLMLNSWRSRANKMKYHQRQLVDGSSPF